jgi:hypothetical protein
VCIGRVGEDSSLEGREGGAACERGAWELERRLSVTRILCVCSIGRGGGGGLAYLVGSGTTKTHHHYRRGEREELHGEECRVHAH